MLLNGLRHDGPEPRIGRRLAGDGREAVAAEGVAGERPGEVRPAVAQPRVQRRRVRHLVLGEVLPVLRGREVEPAAGRQAPALDRVGAGRAQRDELEVLLEVGARQAGRPRHRLARELARHLELLDDRGELRARGGAVEAAEADVDRVDLAPADDAHQRVARLLELQRALDDPAVIARHRERAVVAEVVGAVQEEDVQGVALDPLAAVQEPAQRAHRLGHLDAADVLHRRDRAHLVGHRADPADAGGDVGHLRERPAAQERLEEPRRLEDLQPHLLDAAVAQADVQRSLALDARERARGELALSHATRRTPARPRRRCGTGARRRPRRARGGRPARPGSAPPSARSSRSSRGGSSGTARRSPRA